MKAQRHAAILALLAERRVRSQDELRRLLRRQGIVVTQATLSRDIRELGLIKVSDGSGGTHYAAPPEPAVPPPWEQVVRALLLGVERVGNLLVLRTPAGSAEALGSALDRRRWPEVVGTLAGDDTVLVVARSARAGRVVAERLRGLIGGG